MENSKLKFNKQFYRDFWVLLKPYWVSEEKYYAFSLLILNVICIIGEVRASVAINEFSKNFYDSLQTFNKAALITSLEHFVFILIALIITVGYATYFNGLLCIRWRRWLTKNYLQKWLGNHNHYRMQISGKNVDNPDQRISEDLERFPTATLSAFFMIFQATLTMVTFGIILWNLSGSFSIPMGAYHLTIHGYLFWCAVFYAGFGTWVTAWIGKKLALLNYQQQHYNADFRYALVRFRESSEQIALHQGEAVENEKFNDFFKHIYTNFTRIISVNKRLSFFNNGYNTTSFVFGLTIAIPFYLQKKIQLGGLMQISGAFGRVIAAFSIFVNGFSFFADWRSVIHRLTEFNNMVDSVNSAEAEISITNHANDHIAVNNLNLSLPCGTLLLEKMNYVLQKGETYLLNGPSGVGKSTLLRAFAGIWPHGSGEICLPKDAQIMFLPQKPYLPLGSLKDALLYPYYKNIADNELLPILERCGLGRLYSELNDIKNWSKALSLGEQQLIAFSRLFLYKPDVIFLDEATSALDEHTENIIYAALMEFLPEATIVSVGHRSTLKKFHNHVIPFAVRNERFPDSSHPAEIVTI